MDSRETAVVFLKGIAMGCADAVPGVSGGTIALITGIYDRLITAVTAVTLTRIRSLLTGLNSASGRETLATFREMDGPFLIALGAGIVTALITVLRIVDILLTEAPVVTYGFFFGLIAASGAVLLSEVDVSTTARKAAALAGFLAAYLTAGITTSGFGSGPLVLFAAGMIAVSALVLPGISGSLLLVILGQYEFISGALSTFVDAVLGVVTGGEAGIVVETAPPIVSFVAGGVVGLFTIAHIVRRALTRYRAATIAFLVSLVLGALRAPLLEVGAILSGTGQGWLATLPEFGGAAVLGAVLILAVDRYAGAVEF